MRTPWIVVLLLLAAVAAVYGRTVGFGFTVYDDDEYVYANPLVKNGLTADGIVRAFTEERAANWHPVTWLSHMLDVSLFGIEPGPHHLVNVLFHGANAVLVLLLLAARADPLIPAALVAFLFAIHPLHVESVAWIAERKDLLSAFFGLLAIGAYGRGVRRGRPVCWPALFWYALSLAAKPMLVTLPLLLVVLDYWPLDRRGEDGSFPVRALLVEKWPFFLLAAGEAAVTLWAQAQGGAIQSLASYPLSVRLLNLPTAYLFYLGKMVWPAGLAVIYPHPGTALPVWKAVGSAIVLGAITVAAWRWRRAAPYLAAGWAWYVIALVPVIGLVQVGYQAVADRYSYLPLLGPFVILAWGGHGLAARYRLQKPAAAAAVGVLVALAVVAWRQVGYWRDSFSLFNRALAVTERNFVAENHLGLAWLEQGDLGRAASRFRRALAIKADHFGAWNNLGIVMLRRQRWQEAERFFRRALAIRPTFRAARTNLALALYFQHRRQEAADLLEESLRQKPDDPVVLDNLGNVLLDLGRIDEAIDCFQRSVAVDPGFAAAYADLARAYARKGDRQRATTFARRALELDPSNPIARRLLGGGR